MKVVEAQAAADKSERDRIAAEERAKQEQAVAVIETERKAAQEAARIEQECIAREAANSAKIEAQKREAERQAADIEHRRTVNGDVVEGLVAAGLSDKQAKAVIAAIVGGLVKHVTINY